MRGAVDFLRGSVRVELDCRYSERAVNICARNHVDFWDLRRESTGTSTMTVSLPGYVKLRRVAADSGAFTVRIVRRRGAPFFLWRLRRRYALLMGMGACLFMLGLSSMYVWQIDVVGNGGVPSSEILAALRKEGVDIGVSVFDYNPKFVINSLMLDLPELSFITLNNYGSRIEVLVREKIPVPDVYDPDVPVTVYAKKPGIITSITALNGWRTASVGDTVDAGDELISARVPIGEGYLTHAAGEVEARTWYTLSAKTPLSTQRKTYTGRRTVRRAIFFGGKRINLYFIGGNPYTGCDKISTYKRLTLPGGAVLPVTLVREEYSEYTCEDARLTPQFASDTLRAELLRELNRILGDTGSVVSTQFTEATENNVLTVTLNAECLEDIAQERRITDEPAAPGPAVTTVVLSGD